MNGADASTLLAVLFLVGYVCHELNAPTWLVIVGPLVYVGLAVAVMSA